MNRTRRTLSGLAVVGALLWTVVAFAQALPSGATAKTAGRPRAVDQSPDPYANPDFTVTADKTTGVHDGDTIHITVTPHPGFHVDPSYWTSNPTGGSVYECAASTTATQHDVEQDQTKCAQTVYSTAQPQYFGSFYWYPDGSKAVGSVVIGVGVARNPSDKTQQVTCDETHPCRLALAGHVGNAEWFDASTLLTFAAASTNTVAGCNGIAANDIHGAAPDRLTDQWAAWTAGECAAGKTPGEAQSTFMSFSGEADAFNSFSSGGADLAYSAVGPDTDGFKPATSRPWVAIPVALNASVLAIAGGHRDPTNPPPGVPIGLPQPFDSVQMTMSEVADLVSRGPAYAQTTTDILNTNPGLRKNEGLDNGENPYLPKGPNSLALFSSSTFVARAATYWKSNPVDTPPNQPRPVMTDFSALGPTGSLFFNTDTTNFYTSRSNLSGPAWTRINMWPSGETVQTMWILTDLATANYVGAEPVHVVNGAGDPVAPATASVQAAVPTMQRAPDGMLRPNPSGSADKAGTYPLSFVEYAIAPAQPLVDAKTCTLKTGAQSLLDNWLTYITTGGQSKLVDSLVPLTPALRLEAAAAIAKVGKSPTTGACAGKVRAPNGKPVGGPGGGKGPNGGAGGFGSAGAGGVGAGGLGSGLGANGADNTALGGSGLNGSVNPSAETSAGAIGYHATQAPTAASRRQAQKAAEQASIKMPGFLGATPVSALIPPVSLLLITLITYIAGLGTSGRRVAWPRLRRGKPADGEPHLGPKQADDEPRLGWLRRLRPAQ